MSYLLEVLGRGLLTELAAAFRDLLHDDGRYATPELEERVEREPRCAEHHCRLGIRFLCDHRAAEARAAFTNALQCDPTNPGAHLGLACALDEQGHTVSARQQLETSLNTGPHAATLFALGFCHEKLGEPDQAVAAYQSALELAPKLRNAHERLAAIHLKLGDAHAAIPHYEHLCYCTPDDTPTAMILANLFLRTGRHDEALARYQFALDTDPENWELKDEFVTACIQSGRPADAIQYLQEAIKRRPECAQSHLRLGDLYRELGRNAEALASFAQAVELNPSYLEATIKLGTCQLRDGAFESAARTFCRATEINDRVLSAYVGMGVCQLALGHTDQARASFEAAAGVEPGSSLLFSETARLQLQVVAARQVDRYLSPKKMAHDGDQGPPQPRIADMLACQVQNLQDALRAHPNHADLHYRLGLLLRHTGNLTAAVNAFQNAVRINPHYLKALTKLGLALREAGRLEEAVPVFQQALSIDPESIELHYQLGLIFTDRSAFAPSLERLERAADDLPHNPDYVANLALALQDMGLLDRADAAWHTLCDFVPATPAGQTLLRDLNDLAVRRGVR